MKEICFLNAVVGKLPDSGSLYMEGENLVEVRTVRGYPSKGGVIDFTQRRVSHSDGLIEGIYFLVQGTKGVKIQDGEIVEAQGVGGGRLRGKNLELARKLAALEMAVTLSLCKQTATLAVTDNMYKFSSSQRICHSEAESRRI